MTLLIIGVISFGFQSCGGDDKDEPSATIETVINFSKPNAIIGKWFQTKILWEDGSTTKSEDRSIIFKANGTFEYHWGDGGIYSASGTYTYTPLSKDKGVAHGKGGAYTFTFENYEDFRYKVSIEQPKLSGIVDINAVCIFGMISE